MAQNQQRRHMTNEEVKQALLEFREEDRLRKQTDPEYRELWEKREKELQKFIFPNDSKN